MVSRSLGPFAGDSSTLLPQTCSRLPQRFRKSVNHVFLPRRMLYPPSVSCHSPLLHILCVSHITPAVKTQFGLPSSDARWMDPRSPGTSVSPRRRGPPSKNRSNRVLFMTRTRAKAIVFQIFSASFFAIVGRFNFLHLACTAHEDLLLYSTQSSPLFLGLRVSRKILVPQWCTLVVLAALQGQQNTVQSRC